MMDMNWFGWILLTSVIIGFGFPQDLEPEDDNICNDQQTCGGCISASSRCAWCQHMTFDDVNNTRCDYLESLVDNGCQQTSLIYPTHEETFIRNENPRDSDATGDTVQLSPQEVKVIMRPRLEYNLAVTFRLAKDYPVDLYCVMDLSFSMKKSKDQLANLGNELAEQMRTITANFKLGFGSYIDKRISPYISIVPEKLESPCSKGCAPTYGFKNDLPLTMYAQRFSESVRDSVISGNLDTPEGTFDAIMQAVACKEPIGWRDVSRKILLVSTDNIYHTAGDGKLAGIVTPNDGLCHLDQNNEYNMSLYQDYPSISHLGQRVADENVNVIFGIVPSRDTATVEAAYHPLPGLIPGSVVVTMERDSSNIVDVIKQNYEKISSKVELKHDAPDWVDISYITSCLGGPETESNECDGLRVGDSVQFRMVINVTECPADPADRELDVTVYPVGLADRLVLHLQVQCSCPCELPEYSTPPEENSPACSGSGTYECGACTCHPGISGRQCTCDEGDTQCKRTVTSDVCSGRGSCECGKCVCDQLSAKDPNKMYSGKFCECDNYSCDYYGGKLCGGSEQGECQCGKCVCKDGFTGPACNCPTSKDMCMNINKLVCSGHGQCDCGECRCAAGYQGKLCSYCPSCPGLCEANKACVQCTAFGTEPYSEVECKANCSHVVLVESINKDDTSVCKFQDEDKCYFYFTDTRSTQQVQAQVNKECPEPVNKIGIIVGVVCSVTIIGIILLIIWKVLVTIYDRIEYAKFERERNAEKWQVDDNPLYKPTTSTFQNPTFDKPKQS